MTQSGAYAIAGALALTLAGYVGYYAVQEDNSMRPGSPLAWLLVDERLWALEPPDGCERVGYWTTVGDGPKLPGSDTTLHCRMDREAAEAWASEWLAAQALDTTETLGTYEIGELDGGVAVRISLLDAP